MSPPPNQGPADPRIFLSTLFGAVLNAVDPFERLMANLPHPPRGRTVVVGAGKAAGAMAEALEGVLAERWLPSAVNAVSGLVVTRRGHARPTQRIEVVEAAHPVPDQAGLEATARMLARLESLSADDLVIGLFSGGGSALLSQPLPGIDLADKQALTEALLASGADIRAFNTVRKHISAVKGGRLARAAAPARVVSMIVSDVPGDDISVIASGPTVADPSTCADALAVLARIGVTPPPSITRVLESGEAETPKPDDPCFEKVENRLIITPMEALRAAAEAAREAGVKPVILGDALEGEAAQVARALAPMALSAAIHEMPLAPPCVLLSGGELTVTLPPPEARTAPINGGPNGEFLLAAALALKGHPRIWGMACDTDGKDGSGHNAGAILTPDTLARARAQALDPEGMLDHHQSCWFFERLDDLVVTGPTLTNVNDFRAFLVMG
ncbi:glycerate kinase type-2 family protein [Roseospirillum parvum]|uniref:Hydroxypyruvate reductase n=1 Tax=Roseospirillum parvum TaxID=83401 RepID=A0A1G7Y6J0_9PROT|nr:glycerate kinase [Roseospirillum parvum]SDG91943.1 hydroxypyruvate reductase [Roseospirillum parvum]